VRDSTPVECGRSRQTVRRSALAGWAAYGYSAAHSRFFWGLRLHLVTTLDGLPIAFALTRGVQLLRPAFMGEAPRSGQELLRPLRQRIESVNQTLEAQLDLEHHGGRTIQGVTVRVLQRLLALTAAIWHDHHTNQPSRARCSPATTNLLPAWSSGGHGWW
jgi:hypothetical protein